jgi:hypothetical protein
MSYTVLARHAVLLQTRGDAACICMPLVRSIVVNAFVGLRLPCEGCAARLAVHGINRPGFPAHACRRRHARASSPRTNAGQPATRGASSPCTASRVYPFPVPAAADQVTACLAGGLGTLSSINCWLEIAWKVDIFCMARQVQGSVFGWYPVV